MWWMFVIMLGITDVIEKPNTLSAYTFGTSHWFWVTMECKIIVVPYYTVA
jgi:hypothetical protein